MKASIYANDLFSIYVQTSRKGWSLMIEVMLSEDLVAENVITCVLLLFTGSAIIAANAEKLGYVHPSLWVAVLMTGLFGAIFWLAVGPVVATRLFDGAMIVLLSVILLSSFLLFCFGEPEEPDLEVEAK